MQSAKNRAHRVAGARPVKCTIADCILNEWAASRVTEIIWSTKPKINLGDPIAIGRSHRSVPGDGFKFGLTDIGNDVSIGRHNDLNVHDAYPGRGRGSVGGRSRWAWTWRLGWRACLLE